MSYPITEEDEIILQSRALRELNDQDDREEAVTGYLWGACYHCKWQGSGMYWVGNKADLERSKDKMIDDHKAKSPDCDREPSIG